MRTSSALWGRYFQRLVRLAGARLPAHCRRSFDEEDVALSAFQSFCERAGRGQFPQLDDRDDLWRLLATITVRKALDTMRHQTRQKRGGGCVLGESALLAGRRPRRRGGRRGPQPGAHPRRGRPLRRRLLAIPRPAARPGAAVRRDATAGGLVDPGDRPGDEGLDQDRRPEAPAHPGHLEPGEPVMGIR